MILVTGATGIIGSHLTAHLLIQGKEVRALVRPKSNTEHIREVLSFYTSDYHSLYTKINFVEGDITDIYSIIDALPDIEFVYHCAGMVSFEESKLKELLQVNANGTANMVNACLESNVKHFSHVSSVATMPNHDKKDNIDETVFWKSSPDNSAYAISKYNAEREVWRGQEEGLNISMVNPSVVLGAGCWGQSSGRLIEECYKGTRFYTNGITGFVDVRDVVECMIGLVDKQIIGKRFVVSGSNTSFRDVLNLFHRAFGNKLPSVEAGKWMLKTGELWERMFSSHPRITKATIDAGLSASYYSNNQIKKALQHEFRPIDQTILYVSEKYKTYRAAK